MIDDHAVGLRDAKEERLILSGIASNWLAMCIDKKVNESYNQTSIGEPSRHPLIFGDTCRAGRVIMDDLGGRITDNNVIRGHHRAIIEI